MSDQHSSSYGTFVHNCTSVEEPETRTSPRESSTESEGMFTPSSSEAESPAPNEETPSTSPLALVLRRRWHGRPRALSAYDTPNADADTIPFPKFDSAWTGEPRDYTIGVYSPEHEEESLAQRAAEAGAQREARRKAEWAAREEADATQEEFHGSQRRQEDKDLAVLHRPEALATNPDDDDDDDFDEDSPLLPAYLLEHRDSSAERGRYVRAVNGGSPPPAIYDGELPRRCDRTPSPTLQLDLRCWSADAAYEMPPPGAMEDLPSDYHEASVWFFAKFVPFVAFMVMWLGVMVLWMYLFDHRVHRE